MRQYFSKTIKYLSKTGPFLAVLALVSLVARSIFLLKSDVWHDEGYTTMIIKQPLGEIIARTVNDVHPPFYYLILNIWQSIFGPSLISLRGFSVVAGILTVLILYLLVRRLFSEKAAKLAGLFAALGPFLVRYSDEMRMYSLAALLATASTYALVAALDKKTKRQWLWWVGYGLAVAAGIYTQYFFIFLVPVHGIYALYIHRWKITQLLKNKGWWLGNLLAGGLFLPWLPVMLAQMSRVQEGFWIPAMDISSIPKTFSMFMTYNHECLTVFGLSLPILAIILSWIFLKKQRTSVMLLASWLVAPFIFVTILSINRPVYIDRYFTYSAPAFYALLAIAIVSIKAKLAWLKPTLIAAVCLLFIYGISNFGATANHQMGSAASVVNQNYRQGDEIISAELYTYFDFSYYNQTGKKAKLLSEKPFGKYGEYSLIHDQPELRIANLQDIKSDRVWLIGKTGEHDYFEKDIPANWQEQKLGFSGGDSVVKLYEIN